MSDSETEKRLRRQAEEAKSRAAEAERKLRQLRLEAAEVKRRADLAKENQRRAEEAAKKAARDKQK